MIHHTPLDIPIAGPSGNPGAAGFTSFGCPVFSAGNAQVTETIPIEAQSTVLKWVQQVALQGEAYKNEIVEIFGEDGGGIAAEDDSWGTPQADGKDDDEPEGQAKNTEGANGKAKGGEEAQTIKTNEKATEENIKALEQNIKATEENIKATKGNIKAMVENMKAGGANRKRIIEENDKTLEENNKAIEENDKTIEENDKAIGENNRLIEANNKAKAASQAKKEAAQAESASTKATSTQATGSNTKTDNKVVSAKGDDMAETGGVKTHSENTAFLPTDEGPNAEDMKELVTEMKDLRATH